MGKQFVLQLRHSRVSAWQHEDTRWYGIVVINGVTYPRTNGQYGPFRSEAAAKRHLVEQATLLEQNHKE